MQIVRVWRKEHESMDAKDIDTMLKADEVNVTVWECLSDML